MLLPQDVVVRFFPPIVGCIRYKKCSKNINNEYKIVINFKMNPGLTLIWRVNVYI